ncbi:Outer arm dynein light chain 1 protein [Prunus dulcis]|uniref:Outer arm dynein light chain 1 protein n=1 Tax=Prunus dulcis TaxID=3755 RepID=A0A4Y1RIQ2_PRUDU|nr:Outer arm dynein light chain 1 protein [Prunus dulcis]
MPLKRQISMAVVTGDRYLEKLVHFVEQQAGSLIDGSLVLKLNPAGFHYVNSRLEALLELESLLAGAPVDYLRAYVSDLGDHRALEQLRRILRLLTSLKVVSVLPPPARDPTPLSFWPFGRLRVLELRGCDLSTSAAKGLLELRHTLEKIICHNSTDALRHVFASRIAEIKDSPQWNRLSFVSCACNGLVLMDESLQLLPAVETLDLSRNKFAKVDNLRKCVKLKHLDLGFNHLRTISSISEELDFDPYSDVVGPCRVRIPGWTPSSTKLVVGRESIMLCPLLKLDDKEISTREFWKRQLIIASRQKRPASFGFYSPAKCDPEGGSSINRRRVEKVSRLASIVNEEESTHLCSDQESVSCDNEIQSREEIVMSDDDAEIVDLMTRVERMKKERSVLWLREFKEWLDHASGNIADSSRYSGDTLHVERENYIKSKASWTQLDYVQASGDESSTNVLESDRSFLDVTTGSHARHFDQTGSMGNAGGVSPVGIDSRYLKEDVKVYSHEGTSTVSAQTKSSDAHSFTTQRSYRMVENLSMSALSVIDDISESYSLSAFPGSPPHYQEDILHRRHNLEEEILQLSAESYSVASSDSNTSCSEDDNSESKQSASEVHHLLNENWLNKNSEEHPYSDCFKYYGIKHEVPHVRENDKHSVGKCVDQTSSMQEFLNLDHSLQSSINDVHSAAHDVENSHCINEEGDLLERRKGRQKTKRRVVTLLDDENMIRQVEPSPKLNGNLDNHVAQVEIKQEKQHFYGGDFHEIIDEKQMLENRKKLLFYLAVKTSCMCYSLVLQAMSQGCHKVEDIREVVVGIGLHVVSLIFKECPTFKNNNDFLLDSVVISNLTGESWFSRSLFVAGEHVVDVRESRRVTLAVECAMSEFCPSGSAKIDSLETSVNEKKIAPGSMTWKLQWFFRRESFQVCGIAEGNPCRDECFSFACKMYIMNGAFSLSHLRFC